MKRVLALALVTACGDDGAGPADAAIDVPTGPCTCVYSPAAAAGTIAENGVNELSGVATSLTMQDVVWSHEDGDRTAIYAFTTTGATKGTVELTGVTTVDVEDIAVASCPGGSCVFVADIGDNDLVRGLVQIYEFPEPASITGTMSVTPTKYDILYPDGPHNAEALFADPRTNVTFAITKQDANPSTVFAMPRDSSAATTAEVIGTISIPDGDKKVTGADFYTDSCGSKLLVRTNAALYELRGGPQTPIAELLAATLVKVPVAVEPQGEAVSYAREGRGYFTVSEVSGGADPRLMRVGCQ